MVTLLTLGGLSIVFVAFLVYYLQAPTVIKVVAMSLLILCGIFSERHYRSVLGAPIEMRPPDGFLYVWHEITNYGEIVIWANVDGLGNRLYKIPYDRETAKALEEAGQSKEEGIPVEGQFIQGADGEGSYELEFNETPTENIQGAK